MSKVSENFLPLYYDSIGPVPISVLSEDGSIDRKNGYQYPHRDLQDVTSQGVDPLILSGELVFLNGIEEYLNLAYHGMRAKNPNFNVKMVKEFDTSIKQVEVVVNDLSRVFLNLLNNSLHALDERKKREGASYTNPTLTVSTQNIGNYIRIRIRDNGVGIKEKDKPNIFTPFFTTKATGFGTGLGLSISYNIIVREHGGSITFESEENEFTEFIITIPLQPKKEKETITNEYHGSR